MTTAPISVRTERRPSFTLLESPLTIVMAIPANDLIATFPVVAATFPSSQLTEVTAANVDDIGTAPAVNPATLTPMARAAYDFIEAGANVHLFVLPFAVDAADNAVTRNGKVVTAINAALTSPVQLAKLPTNGVDVLLVPGETTFATAADNIYAAMETLCAPAALGCIGLVDAGGYAYDNAARPSASEPTDANVTLWSGNNRNINLYAFSNRADVANYNDMWGSVIAAAHHARYVSRNGIWAHPFNLRDPALGVGSIRPQRVFDPGDASSSAIALERDDKVGSLVQYDGADFIWGGESYETEDDPRQVIANHIVANRATKRAKRIIARFLKLRAKGSTLESLRLSIQAPLQALYVPNAIRDIQVRRPEFTGGRIRVRMPADFYDFIDSIELTAEVYHGEVV